MLKNLTCFIFSIVFPFIQSSDPCISFNVDRVVGKKLPVNPIKIVKDVGLRLCLKQCERHPSCLSINFNRKTFECELLNVLGNSSTRFVDESNYIFEELTKDDDNRTLCGESLCNNYSTCISTSSTKKICIATECSEPVPFLENGTILSQSYSPPSVTFGCQQNYIAVGQGNTTKCTPGGKWSPLSLICEFLGSVRLQSGSSPNEGRVEISINNTWGTICDDSWTETEARVVCQMMGYTGIATPRTAAYFGEGEGPIWLDGVKCSGSESHLLLCEHSTIGSHNCYHFEDAGVTCE